MSITIFTDGAARGNPGPGGWGGVVLSDDTVFELGGREEHTTNNRMELTAAIKALESVPQEREITVYTDSAYVVSGITRWVIGWRKNKWVTSKKEEVLNKDLWEKLIDAVSYKTVSWKLIKGHSGTSGNERCDVIATSFADRIPPVLYNGSRERYGVNVNIIEVSSSTSKSKSKSKAYSYVSRVDGVILTNKTWDECKARVNGVSGAKYKKSVSPADEEEIIREFSD
ncbi:ribonuclease HI [Patescibacteria group bacterium]|nr:ribonuclease HI [Patescibacteria group bacterium]